MCIAKVPARFGGRRRNILRGGVPRLPYETQLCGSVHESPVRFTARAIAVTRIMNGSSIDSVGDAPLEKNEFAANAVDKNEAVAPIL